MTEHIATVELEDSARNLAVSRLLGGIEGQGFELREDEETGEVEVLER